MRDSECKLSLSKIALSIDAACASVESIALSILGRFAAWVGPVPVAIFTSTELQIVFGVGPFLALVSAAAMELMGINLANRWLTLRNYQDGKRKNDPDVDVKLARGLMVSFYVMDIIISSLIVAKRIFAGGAFTNVIAVLFPVASIFSIISLNQGVQHQRALLKISQETLDAKEERKRRADERKRREQETQRRADEQKIEQWETLSKQQRILSIIEGNGHLTQDEIAEHVGCTRGYVSKVLGNIGNYQAQKGA
jgi:hypothetical protein